MAGAAKAGTTALWHHLDAHPDVFMSDVKEPYFFSPARKSNRVVRDPHAYARLFAPGAGRRYRGEASPGYLQDPDAPARIRAAVGAARIVVSLRDPVERAYSNYWTLVRIGAEPISFEQAVREELDGVRTDIFALPPPYLSRGYYAEQLERWLEVFDDAVLVLFLDELAGDTATTMRRVYEWLGLDRRPADHLDPAPVYPFALPRGGLGRAALRVPGARRVADRLLRGRLRARVRGLVFDDRKPPLDPAVRARLREHYAPHDERLRALLGRPLPWDA